MFSPDGRTLAVIDSVSNTVRFWDVHDPAHSRAFGGLVGGRGTPINSVAFDPRGDRLVTTSPDMTIRLWDFTDRAHPTTLGGSIIPPADSRFGWNLAFAPDGNHLVGTNARGEIRWWDLDPDRVAQRLCQGSTGVLTADVWRQYLPGVPYRAACEKQA